MGKNQKSVTKMVVKVTDASGDGHYFAVKPNQKLSKFVLILH